MAYRLRTLMDIVDGILATIRANSTLTDTNRGSIERAIAEAAALQDADQYVQIGRLKGLFSYRTAKGEDLDERVSDFGITRFPPRQSTGRVKFGDSAFTAKVETTLTGLHGIGSGTLTVASGTGLPTTGGSVIVERAISGQRELVPYTSRAGNVLTLTGTTTISHPNGSSVILSTAGVDRTFAIGTIVSIPEFGETEQIDFRTLALATLLDGDIYSLDVTALSMLAGEDFNVGSGLINTIQSPPFATATVVNDGIFLAGADEETDEDLVQRVADYIQSLSEGNYVALQFAALNVELESGQRVVFSQVVEEFTDPDVSVYIDDGAGTAVSTADQTEKERLIFPAETGQRRARLLNWPVVSGTLKLKKSDLRGTIEIVTPGVGVADMEDTGAAFTPGALVGREIVDADRNLYPITANTATEVSVTVAVGQPMPTIGDYAILATGFLTIDVDYLFNETTGDIELTSGLTAGDALYAYPSGGPSLAYTYYTGLMQEVQKVLNGDPRDLATYPGVKATGVKVKVRAPVRTNITINTTVITAGGIVEEDLEVLIKDAIQNYVNSLGIGDDVIVAELITAVMGVDGVTDVKINTPSSNYIIPDGTIARTRASIITVL